MKIKLSEKQVLKIVLEWYKSKSSNVFKNDWGQDLIEVVEYDLDMLKHDKYMNKIDETVRKGDVIPVTKDDDKIVSDLIEMMRAHQTDFNKWFNGLGE